MPDLDLILSGHTHTELEKPIQHGSTYVVSCGEYGKNLGELTLTQQADGRWAMSAYELIPITSDIAVHAATQQTIDSFMDTVDTDYLARFGYTKDQVLAENDIVFSTQKDLENIHEEHNLGDIIADAYVYAVENAAGYDGVPVDLAVVPSGTVRDTYARGDITVEQVFNSFSLGIGADGVPGYPLISVYLTGREIRTAAEIDASVSDFMTTARLYCSGLNFTYNPHRLLLNRVTDVCLEDDGQRVALEDDKLYRIVADLYSGQMLSAVTDMSYGILAIVPKYADGTPITDFEDVIITENGRELKAWDLDRALYGLVCRHGRRRHCQCAGVLQHHPRPQAGRYQPQPPCPAEEPQQIHRRLRRSAGRGGAADRAGCAADPKAGQKGQTPRRIRPPLPKGRIGAILDTNTV